MNPFHPDCGSVPYPDNFLQRTLFMKKEILCTLGPSSMDKKIIRRLSDLGVTLFRINLSHTKLDDLRGVIEFVQECTDVPLCIDTEGAQIRTGQLSEPSINILENSIIRIPVKQVPGNAEVLNFHPEGIINTFEAGDLVSIDFDSVLCHVTGFEGEGDSICAVLRVLNGGTIGRNKAVTIDRDIPMPPLTDKDQEAVKLGASLGIKHFALSFAHKRSDLDQIKNLAGKGAFIISKIECLEGLRNLEEIIEDSDAILIDRGDLSRQIPLEHIPRAQKSIIQKVKEMDTRVYVATNLLETMVSSPTPTRAEVNDIYNTLCDGADGLVLAAETAIGAYPIRCASMIVKMINHYNESQDFTDVFYHDDPVSLLPEPHGGKLVHRENLKENNVDTNSLKRLVINHEKIIDCENLALGVYSPLSGFMDKETLKNVLETNRLPVGLPWSMPLILQVTEAKSKKIAPGDSIALAGNDDRVHALMDVTEVFQMDMEDVAEKWFGTSSAEHPGVYSFFEGGEIVVAGNINLIERAPISGGGYTLTPAQSRYILSHKGWSRAIGFPVHTGTDEGAREILTEMLETSDADGALITAFCNDNPESTFNPSKILESFMQHSEIQESDSGSYVLGHFNSYPRHCGAREIVFRAICLKNFGCSHFIVSEDVQDLNNFSASDDTIKLFKTMGDLGIEPLFPESGAHGLKIFKAI